MSGDQAHTAAPERSSGLLVEIAAGLAKGSDLGLLLGEFLQPIMRLAGAQAGAVRVLSEAGDQLQLVSSVGLPDKLCGKSAVAVDRHCGYCGAAADGHALVWASDLRDCSDRTGSDYFGQGCQQLLAVPLQHRGRTLGVYNLFFSSGRTPPPEVQGLLTSVGELLGLALNNARLEQERLRTTLLQERQAMAADVHDSLAQSLAFMKMRMPLLQDAVVMHDEQRARGYCEDVRQALTQAHTSLRSIISQLRAPMDPKGLVHALGAAVDAFRRMTGTELDFINDWPDLELPLDQEAQIFHIVQEALHNVARHAGSEHAWLYIGPMNDQELQILVDDDGSGMPGHTGGSSHYGLDIMMERARRLGGELSVSARHGGGTRVRLSVPLTPARKPNAAATATGAH